MWPTLQLFRLALSVEQMVCNILKSSKAAETVFGGFRPGAVLAMLPFESIFWSTVSHQNFIQVWSWGESLATASKTAP